MTPGRNEVGGPYVAKGMDTHPHRNHGPRPSRLAAYALLVPIAALLLGGCGSAASDPEDNVSDVPSSPASSDTDSPDSPDSPDVADAIADLSERQGVQPEKITVVSHDQVTWRDASLGCPEDGKMYTTMLTKGVRVVLESGGKKFEYHGGQGKKVFLCEKPQQPVEDESGSDTPQ